MKALPRCIEELEERCKALAQHAADLQDRGEAHQHPPGRGGGGEKRHDHGIPSVRRPGLWIVLASDLVRGASTTNPHHRDLTP